ncbi:DNA/RNA non-specific endonuclease [Acetobacter sp. DsW_063]|uniref:DNA/RNA non-specific endonuclease n=1 Tax=Acetobacter sp. DsW_063 TaxID=1514894 RepID=UPI001E346126|nr:DNA/RNA non-specific endonuclease [Acetobacter sp. DsW_063]
MSLLRLACVVTSKSTHRCFPGATALLVAAIAAMLPVAVFAACPEHFAAGRAPQSDRQLIPLCSAEFASGYSAEDREPVWSAERLTRAGVIQGENLKGRGHFHEDMRLSRSVRSTRSDYKRSGWSMGHLAPSGDATTRSGREETFALSNIVPQAIVLNSGHWNEIERNVRRIVKREGETYVVTGPAFREPLGVVGADRIRVPSSVWKAVYAPGRHAVSLIVCRNVGQYGCNAVGLDALARVAGVKPFPGLPVSELRRDEELDRFLLSGRS